MRVSLGLLALLVLLITGCAPATTVKEVEHGEGLGVKQMFPYSSDAVYIAVLAAAHAKELDIVENDHARGKIILSHGTSLLSWGEKIAVFIRRRGPNLTQVEVVSKPVSGLNLAPDWATILLDQIEAELKARK